MSPYTPAKQDVGGALHHLRRARELLAIDRVATKEFSATAYVARKCGASEDPLPDLDRLIALLENAQDAMK